MQKFANLLDCLTTTPSRNGKLGLLVEYFRSAPDPDRGFALAALTDGLFLRLPLRRALGELMADKIDPVLYQLSRDYVGDTAETVSLLWPDKRDEGPSPRLAEVVAALELAPRTNIAPILGDFLDRLDVRGRWALLKLVGGAPRVGVSARLAKTALAQMSGHELSDIEEMWHALKPPYADLFAWLDGRGPRPTAEGKPVFRPLMLAHPIEESDWADLSPTDIVAEWKWDGVRVQIAAGGGEVRIFSRSGDDISASFPEIVAAFQSYDAVLDGELLVVRDGVVAPFNDLQQRLNRKTVTAKMLRDYPAFVRLYDILIDDGEDARPLPFAERRERLEAWHTRHRPRLTDVSAIVTFEDFGALCFVEQRARGRHRRADAEAQVEPVSVGTPQGPLVEMEARRPHRRLRADVRPARLRQALVLLFRLYLRRLARDRGRRRQGHARAGSGRQGILRFHRRGASASRPLYP
jgi:DNA ligase-1